jgi:hypothetical protein
MKTETFNAIIIFFYAILIKVFQRFSWWYSLMLGFDSLCTPMCTSCPSVVCKYMSSLDLIWFSPTRELRESSWAYYDSLVMHKKVLLSKRFQMLWDHTLYKEKVLYRFQMCAHMHGIMHDYDKNVLYIGYGYSLPVNDWWPPPHKHLVTLLVKSNTFWVVSLNHFRQEIDFA